MAEPVSILGGLNQEATQGSVAGLLLRLWNLLSCPPGFDLTQNRGRVTAAVESGTITTVTTVTTVTTCAMVSTVSSLAAIDGFQGRLLAWGQDQAAWAECVRARIT